MNSRRDLAIGKKLQGPGVRGGLVWYPPNVKPGKPGVLVCSSFVEIITEHRRVTPIETTQTSLLECENGGPEMENGLSQNHATMY